MTRQIRRHCIGWNEGLMNTNVRIWKATCNIGKRQQETVQVGLDRYPTARNTRILQKSRQIGSQESFVFQPSAIAFPNKQIVKRSLRRMPNSINLMLCFPDPFSNCEAVQLLIRFRIEESMLSVPISRSYGNREIQTRLHQMPYRDASIKRRGNKKIPNLE